MTQFDDRERAAEKKFELDQEKEFRAQARRAKLVGLWAAEQMGLDGAEAEGYAKDVVAHDLAEKGDEDLFRKIRADFDAAKVTLTDHQIRTEMEDKLVEARKQIAAG